jgi:N-dimethylarginine dimethylaminohydrolase
MNSTTGPRLPMPNGGQPRQDGGAVADKPALKGSPATARSAGVLYSRRAKSPAHLPKAKIAQIQAAQVRAGVREESPAGSLHPEPAPLTSAAGGRDTGMAGSIFNSIAGFFSGQKAEEGEAPAQAGPQTQSPGHEGVITLKFDNEGVFPPDHARNQNAYVRALKNLFAAQDVHVVEAPREGWPFVRNVATVRPDGTLVTSEITSATRLDKGMDKARDALEGHFRKLGLPVQRLAEETNFANFEYVESKDTLILARSRNDPMGNEAQIRRVFGNPQHVLHVSLDLGKKHGGWEKCYDLDLAFNVAMNSQGEPVAMLHPDCLESAARGALGPAEFKRQLTSLGFHVVEITQQEQLALATNSVSNPDVPGKLLFTRDSVPKGLIDRLAGAGVEAVLPDSNKRLLGYTDGKLTPIFGLHCLTLNFRIPDPEASGGMDQPAEEPARKDL